MTLVSPNLDDRDWDEIIRGAREVIRERCPEWSDLSPSDPGMVLIEVFAYLTDLLIYRVNRIPEKAFIEFLRLLGVRMRPPTAATVDLQFSRAEDDQRLIRIPKGTRVTTEGSGPVFSTVVDAEIAAGVASTIVPAIHCEEDVRMPIGEADGQPGLAVTVPRPPILDGAVSDWQSLAVYVESDEVRDFEGEDEIEVDGKRFRRWREVTSFADTAEDDPVFWADRLIGRIQFAPRLWLERREARGEGADERVEPAALGRVPRKGAAILATYRYGGGSEGNVAAGVLNKLKDGIADLEVSNPERAKGGSLAETVAQAIERGVHEFRGVERAITALDYELAALRAPTVVRANAFTQRDLWQHAMPGTVEVVLVPGLDRAAARGERITVDELRSHQTDNASRGVAELLEKRRPIGTHCVVSWARYKTVRVFARLIVDPDRATDAVRQSALARLNEHISPLAHSGERRGWRFGQSLHVSHVYEICLSEPGVVFVDSVRLVVAERPQGSVRAIASDEHQPHVWYVCNGASLYRSLNDGKGWELSKGLEEDWSIEHVAVHPDREGWVGLVASRQNDYRMFVSQDCGETWPIETGTSFAVRDLAWLLRDDVPVLLLATVEGLAEMPVGAATAIKLQASSPRNVYAVAVSSMLQGAASVALGTRHAGVWLSRESGAEGTFADIGAREHDVRYLRFQDRDGRTWLWAGLTTTGSGVGQGGCIRWELGRTEAAKDPELLNDGWRHRSCHGLVFTEDPGEDDPLPNRWVLAATYAGEVVALDTRAREPKWLPPSESLGLPFTDRGRLPVLGIAEQDRRTLICSDHGIFRSDDRGRSFVDCTQSEEIVTLPQTWLLCSGEHEIDVVRERVREPSSLDLSSEERTP